MIKIGINWEIKLMSTFLCETKFRTKGKQFWKSENYFAFESINSKILSHFPTKVKINSMEYLDVLDAFKAILRIHNENGFNTNGNQKSRHFYCKRILKLLKGIWEKFAKWVIN